MDLLRRAIDHFGDTNQILQAIEEMAELTVELTHYIRGRNGTWQVAEEIADCSIMLKQLRILFGEAEVDRWEQEKMERLAKIMEKSQ